MQYCHRARDGPDAKFGTDIRPNTFLKSSGKYVSSYFRSAEIRQFVNFDILNFLALFPRMVDQNSQNLV
jgi:hypothetical protein